MSAIETQALNRPFAMEATQNTTTAGTGQANAYNQLGMNSFLTMFTTQLKYQDPTNPLESYELAAQLAQFSSVEKLTELNNNMKEVQSYLASLTNAQMINLIGKDVTGPNGTLQVKDGQATSAAYKLNAAADVTVKIYDEDNVLVRTIKLGPQDAGSHEIKWDGCNDAGEKVAAGYYTSKVEAVDSDGKKLDIQPTIHGTVYSFRLEQGIPYLILNGPDGIRLPISEVQEVMNRA
jgi:flagellar basal-body rod modification protein FlgD